MTDRKRAALLARPGPASDQLRDALRHAGADVVLVADPGVIAADEVISAEPDSVLIALDGIVDDMLDRFDAVLGDPDITVIFEEVDVALAREGWDAARWARHLHAKLYGHRDVLPPGQSDDEDDSHPELRSPGLAIAPREASDDASLTDYLVDLDDHADSLPTDPMGASAPGPSGGGGFQDFDIDGAAAAAGSDAASDPISFDDFKFDPDDDGASGAAADAAPGDNDWSVASDTDNAPDGMATDSSAPDTTVDLNLTDLERRISGMSLAEHDSYGHGPLRGAVIVLAGLGGPDAVRQLLGGLPEDFARPVLVAQKLDGGQHEKLVKQMSRATSLPVGMARAGESAEAGHVYIIAPDVGVGVERGKLVFNDHTDGASWFAALPPSDTALVMLSGSDVAGVDQAMHMAASGALVLGQAVEGCFEPEAPAALSARGGDSGFPVDLARKLADRWPG